MILVTGATGLLGRVLVLKLLQQGKSVRATKRASSNLDEMKDSWKFYTDDVDTIFSRIEWVEVDFSDIHSLENALTGIDEVYHCAGFVSFNPKDRKKMLELNAEGTKNLLYACQNKPLKFCHISSVSVLDGVNSEGVMDEESDFNVKLNHSDYAISKYIAEMEVFRAIAEGLDAVIVNPGIIIGSGNWNQSSGAMFNLLKRLPFSFSGGSSYIDVRDVAEICISLMDKRIFDERFILVSENMAFLTLAKEVRAKFNLSEPKPIPKFLLEVIGVVGNLFGWLIPPLRLVNKSNIKSLTEFRLISSSKVKQELNFKFIPVKESLDFHVNNYIQDLNSK